jgi:hypothetical protein
MELANLKVVKDWQISQNRAAPAIEDLIVKSAEEIIPLPIPVRKGLHLDVDEVLRRSLPNVTQPTVLRRVSKGTPPCEAPPSVQ